ncbi:MAG: hypothetical protein RMJ59_05615 [Candidatus Nitrosocaldus sp.]|nr:hypothetical protein [Candidatus Nitrosocaldus sp.]MDW8275840.1 hypothetical protein [Candidatus Nitrosocaldus sp.]
MPVLKERALLIFEDDVLDADRLKALRARIVTQMLPPHRYDGTITVDDEQILFEGRDLLDGNRFRLSIMTGSIREIHLGFDDVYIGKDSKGKRYQLSPIRLVYADAGRLRRLYIFPEFRGLFRANSSEEVYRIITSIKARSGSA